MPRQADDTSTAHGTGGGRRDPGWAGSTRGAATPPGWRRLRLTVLDRAGHRCQHVDEHGRCTARATDVDHIVNVKAGGTHQLENLQALCAWHHARKSSAEGNAARVRRTSRRTVEQHPGALT